MEEQYRKIVWQQAAGCERLILLNWLKDNSLVLADYGDIWWIAARNGRVYVLDWLFENGYQVAPRR